MMSEHKQKVSQVFIIERTVGNSFTTYKDYNGQTARVPIGPDIIGPFDNVPQAADYLSKNAVLHASYEIVYHRSPK